MSQFISTSGKAKEMVLPHQYLHDLAFGKRPMIKSEHAITENQIQIASVDCTLGDRVYRMQAAGLPHGRKVSELIKTYSLYNFSLTENEGRPLERNVCYIIPLRERLELSDEYWAEFSPKSSTGRCDVFVRVISDYHPHYDQTSRGYEGPLYLEVIPLSSSIIVRSGLALTQFRVRSSVRRAVSREEIVALHSKHGIMRDKNGTPVSNKELKVGDGSLYYHIDLDRSIVGFEAYMSPTFVIDLSKTDFHDPDELWRPIRKPKSGRLVMTPGHFYLLATAERTVIPPELCGQMLPYDVSSGEFRPHYAGFFDNGFGGEHGTTGVLEVRCRDIPFLLEHGQPICRMDFERTLEVPDVLYSGNYTQSGPSLSKHFRRRNEVWAA